ncbi:MAG: hypothetical protein ABFD49_09755 [Armatimonadota bacterium]|nr:hypothetical protein [bacterium]
MKSRSFIIMLVVLAVISTVAGVALALRQANQPDPLNPQMMPQSAGSLAPMGGPPGGGDMQSPAQMQEQQKYTFMLVRMVNDMAHISDKFTSGQAKSILAIMKPIREQSNLTKDQAKDAIRQLQDVLTDEQRNLIAQQSGQQPMGGQAGLPSRMPQQPQGGSPAPGGPPMGGQGAMENFNPFAGSTNAPQGAPGVSWLGAFWKSLEKKSSAGK